jgi:DNA-binding NtrC family response regulator
VKFIQTTRVIVLRGNAESETDLVAGLKAWRIFQVDAVDNVSALEARLSAENFDVLMVDLRQLSGFERAGSSNMPPFPQVQDATDMARIVILSTGRRSDIRLATKAGYDVVLIPPVSPRLVYRHIATVMQKRRRKARRSGDEVAPIGVGPEMQNGGT